MIVEGEIAPRGETVIIVSSVLVFVATIFVALRFWGRATSKTIGVDDWTILAALVLEYGLLVSTILWVTEGHLGYHATDFSFEQVVAFLKTFAAAELIYFLTNQMVRISVLFLYRRIFVSKPFLWATVGLGTIIVLWTISIVVVWIVQCIPVGSGWNIMDREQCINFKSFYAATGIMNFIINVVLIILPVPVVFKLQLTYQRLLGLLLIFLVGAFAVVASLLRLVVGGAQDYTDLSYELTLPAIWTNCEACVGIMCASIPAFPSLCVKVHKGYKNWASKHSKSSSSGVSGDHSEKGSSSAKKPLTPKQEKKMKKKMEKKMRIQQKFGEEKTIQSRAFDESVLASMDRIMDEDSIGVAVTTPSGDDETITTDTRTTSSGAYHDSVRRDAASMV